MEYDKLLELINVIGTSSLTKFTYKEGDMKIELEKKYENTNQILKEDRQLSKSLIENNNTNYEYIKSPLVGTFYKSPSENEDAFVSIGDKISKNQVLGIIEAMKVMNEVTSNVDGIIEDILIENNETVEYSQVLFKIKLI
ncbi:MULTISPECIES: acetyl-CoA carboxylase biotin carboxyl carrier protein [unclassified Romboutsia]|uniref:acetyl-CoA carboxylase biotin carboxyl carrier protein n=1 Tax=unclassified Romboutsia TaxID=2626894 RepID=UPI000F04F275|nr:MULTISPECIES: biotin/lipoyl-containing protein [unclassified Romboutsia]